MAKKTNKTSHILNLITNGEPPAEETIREKSDEPEASDGQERSNEPETGNGTDDFEGAAGREGPTAPGSAVVSEGSGGLKGAGVFGGPAVPESAVVYSNHSAAPDGAAAYGNPAVPNNQVVTVNLAVTGNPAAPGNPVVTVSPEVQKDTAVSGEASKQADSGPDGDPAVPVNQTAPDVLAAANSQPAAYQQGSLSTEKKVTVVNGDSENDKISNAILNSLTDELREEKIFKEENYHMVNVMEQILQRQNLEKYMDQYGVCLCSRCRADVAALILTRLPAKYVVIDSSCVAPIIGFYESKYKIRILTEVIKACMDVKEKPRHNQTDDIGM